jgi:hypothetical protein
LDSFECSYHFYWKIFFLFLGFRFEQISKRFGFVRISKFAISLATTWWHATKSLGSLSLSLFQCRRSFRLASCPAARSGLASGGACLQIEEVSGGEREFVRDGSWTKEEKDYLQRRKRAVQWPVRAETVTHALKEASEA